MSKIALQLDNVWKIFGRQESEALTAIETRGLSKVDVLDEFECVLGVADASLSVESSEIFCIMGLSGSGKSTLLRLVNRLIVPTSGTVTVSGADIGKVSERELRRIRGSQIGMVFQHMALMPHKSVRENVAFPLKVRGQPKAMRWETSEQSLALVGLQGFEDRFPHELSGGMQQRVGLARALASDPDLLLMDEPFSALDPLIRHELQGEFLDLCERLKKTVLFITHDLDEAIRLGDHIGIMKDGRIVQVGTAEDIVTKPADDYVRDFVKGISTLRLVKAHTIMEPLVDYQPKEGEDLNRGPRANDDANLDQLIDLSVETPHPIVVIDRANNPIGVISKDRLLTSIKGTQS